MMESEEIAKLVDGAYKNILEKFNPCSRQLINAGKAYLKALHSAVAASKTYVEAITKLARHAHQGTWGGCTDVGTALMQLVDVQKEIQSQQMNILKAFYVDLLEPLESNLERDSKVVAAEQKRFQQQHKSHQEAYLKATSTVKKQRKKSRGHRSNTEKEIKQIQVLEEEKIKLDAFCQQNLKMAITQERRRYGFVLERQCSLAKHHLAYHSKGQALLQRHLEEWQDSVRTRETLPESIQKMFTSYNEIRVGSEYASANVIFEQDEDDRLGSCRGMRKTRSIDASCLDAPDSHEGNYPRPLSRAKSDFNLASSSASLVSSEYVIPHRPKTTTGEAQPKSERRQVVALYSYLSSGEHQLSFREGDVIVLVGERNKGWQYGENLRNHRSGWFPIAYTGLINESSDDGPLNMSEFGDADMFPSTPSSSSTPFSRTLPLQRPLSGAFPGHLQINPGLSGSTPPQRPLSTFADSFFTRASDLSKVRQVIGGGSLSGRIPPPAPPLPVGLAPYPGSATSNGQPNQIVVVDSSGVVSPTTADLLLRPPRRSLTSPLPLPQATVRLPTSTSLHSSNDSGFCNDTVSTLPQTNHVEKDDDDKPRENIFTSVKLRKVVTNDRSAPMIS